MVYSRKSRFSVKSRLKIETRKIRKGIKTLPRMELDFFRELGYFFINENRYYLMIFFILSPIILALSYYYLHWFFGICFIMGYLEFFGTFWIIRKMFIKTMIRLKLRNENVELKNHNWELFQRF